MVGWVITNRAHQTVSCDAYVGGYPATSCVSSLSCSPMPNCSPSNCLIEGPYSTPNEHCWSADQCNADCNGNKQICCAAHGGTTESGRRQVQFNDSHVSCEDLCASGALWEATYVLHGMVPDMSNPTWVPAGHTSCTTDCVRPACQPLGLMSWGTSPNGPMEYLAYNYCAAHTGRKQCKWFSGNVCGDTELSTTCCQGCAPDGDNHFWNRNQTRP